MQLHATSESASREIAHGTLGILDVETMKTNPQDALLGTVNAGCEPVRVIASPNGEQF